MTWNPDKYREKRERVLGIQKKGISLGILAAMVSVFILLGLAAMTLPDAVSYLQTRHLDDAIYRLTAGHSWPDEILADIGKTAGVQRVDTDHHGGRLVITFDRRRTGPEKFETLLRAHDLSFALLNRVNHRHRQHMTAQEMEDHGETL